MLYGSKKVGEYLKQQREFADLSQGDVSKKMGWKTAQSVSNLERGVAPFPPRIINKYCRIIKGEKKEVVKRMVDIYTERLLKGIQNGKRIRKHTKKKL